MNAGRFGALTARETLMARIHAARRRCRAIAMDRAAERLGPWSRCGIASRRFSIALAPQRGGVTAKGGGIDLPRPANR
jgi:hypothetical protein